MIISSATVTSRGWPCVALGRVHRRWCIDIGHSVLYEMETFFQCLDTLGSSYNHVQTMKRVGIVFPLLIVPNRGKNVFLRHDRG